MDFFSEQGIFHAAPSLDYIEKILPNVRYVTQGETVVCRGDQQIIPYRQQEVDDILRFHADHNTDAVLSLSRIMGKRYYQGN